MAITHPSTSQSLKTYMLHMHTAKKTLVYQPLPRTVWVNRYQNVSILDFMGEVMVTSGIVRPAKLQSDRHNQQTNTHLFIAGCPYCLPANSV